MAARQQARAVAGGGATPYKWSCGCGHVEFSLTGQPFLHVHCFCDDCRARLKVCAGACASASPVARVDLGVLPPEL